MTTGNDRLLDLLTQQATDSLSEAESRELEALLAKDESIADDDLELAAAAAWQALAADTTTPAPASLVARLETDAAAFFGEEKKPAEVVQLADHRPPAEAPPQPPAWFARSGWAIAAGLALVLLIRDPAPELPGPAEARAALLADGPATGVYLWDTPAADGYGNVEGDVVWNGGRQQGFLRLVGMPVNDPSVSQYQLWIIDPDRDAEPVDGGVFDVTASGEVIIPIDAKLLVSSPTAFAITREQPGGVVVSEGPLLVVARTG